MTRKTVALLVLGGGIISVLFITNIGGSSLNEGVLSLSTPKTSNPSFSFERTDSLLEGESDINLTDLVVQRYGQEILKLNPPGGNGSGLYVPNEAALAKLIEAKAGDDFVFARIFTSRDFKTETENGDAAVQNYLEALGEVPEESEQLEFLPAIAATVTDGNQRMLETYAGAVEKYVHHLLTITIPYDWISFHTRYANVWNKRAELARAILAMEEDPLRAIIALKAVPKTAEEELELLAILNKLLSRTS